MGAGACCNSSSPRHATPHFATPRRTQMQTYERRAIYFSEDTHECTRTQEKETKLITTYTKVKDESNHFPGGKVSIRHFVHFVPMELILFLRTDRANLS
jgi:hypothetical protein